MDHTLSDARLNTLAAFLEENDLSIRMEDWVSDMRPDADFGRITLHSARFAVFEQCQTAAQLIECGFAACAVGWACMIESFQRDGLHLVPVNVDTRVILEPEYQGLRWFDAVQAFFGITYGEAIYLFGPDSYYNGEPSGNDVSSRIRTMITLRAQGKKTVPSGFLDC